MGESTDRWQRLQTLFEAASQETTEGRSALLDRECADDPSLRAEVESLLRASERADEHLNRVVRHAAADVQAASSLGPGQALGDYTVDRELGRGGMGAVYLATPADGGEPVAIKVLWAGRWSPELARHFRRERRILASLDHPYVTRVLESGSTDDGVPYEVMEFVDGEPLDTFCDRRMLDLADRVDLFCRVCEAVEHAHQRGIVHRDLKPANVLVETNGTPKLLDFGIAKPLHDAALTGTVFTTRTGVRLMTPTYASPEQVRGEALSAGSDVYSLGVVLYELVTGRLPYDLATGHPGEVLLAIVEQTPRPPSHWIAGGATGLDQVVLRALEKDPDARFASAGLFAAALGEAVRRLS
jgi:serine/threonine protein kinase